MVGVISINLDSKELFVYDQTDISCYSIGESYYHNYYNHYLLIGNMRMLAYYKYGRN